MSCRFYAIVWILLVAVATVSHGVELEWIQQPSNTSTVQGGDAILNCSWQGQLTSNIAVWTSPSGASLFVNNQSLTTDARFSIVGIFDLKITNISKSDQGFYTCTLSGLVPNSAKGYLDVLVSPHTTAVQINNTSPVYVENDVLSFTCSSVGNPAPTIHWYRGATRLVNNAYVNILPTQTDPFETNEKKSRSQLILTLQHTDNNQNFYCYAFNVVNENNPVKFPNPISVYYAPIASLHPSPYNILLRTSGQLECSVKANPPVTQVQWQKDGQLLPSNAMVYQFNNVQKSNAGNYQCTARNQINGKDYTDTANTQVNVIYEPIISVANEIRVNISSNLNILCVVDAYPPPLSIRWRKVDGTKESTSANFIVTSVTKEYTGNYSCIVEYELNPSGQNITRGQKQAFTYVYVQYHPGSAAISASTNPISIGQSLILNCTVADPGFPAPLYEWKRLNDNKIFPNNAKTFTIARSTLQENGNYTCTPYNIMGRGISAMVTVDVHEQPFFVEVPPTTKTVLSDQSGFFFSCKVRGRPAPQIQWYRNGQLIQTGNLYTIQTSRSTVDNYSYLVNSQLLFRGQVSPRGLTIDDIANFTCSESSALQHSVQLLILFKPVTDPDEKVAATANQTTQLSCTVEAYPIPQFNWYRDQRPITANSKYSFELQKKSVAIATSKLVIQDVQSSDFGEYVCIVQNGNGSANKKITLTVMDKPEPPSNLAYLSHTWESVYLKWNAGFNGGQEQSFFIHYTSYVLPGSTKDIPVLPNTATEFNVTELMPGTSYEFRIYGSNSLGRGNYSDPLTIQTKDLAFPVIKDTLEYDEESKSLSIPFTLNDTYCVRIKISTNHGTTWKTVILNNKDCFPLENSAVPFSISDEGVNKVNVSLCLVHRHEVCGTHLMALIKWAPFPSVVPASKQQQKSDLTETEVIIIGCVCAFILISLLIVLIVIVCRRRYRNAKQYQNSTSQPGQVIAHINGNGTAPPKPRRGHDNPDSIPDRNGYPAQHTFSHPNGNIPHDTSYDSQLAKYENEMNMRNIDNMKNDPYLSGPRDYSLGGGSPSTPRKDPQQFLDISEDRKDGSVKSGQESGYSTPDGQKPKKVRHIRGKVKNYDRKFEKVYYSDYVPFAHDPPGHTCGLPCCNSDLYTQRRIGGHYGGCMSVPFQHGQSNEEENFTLRRNQRDLLKGHLTFKTSGFLSVQPHRKKHRRQSVLRFATIRPYLSALDNSSDIQKHFIQGRGITLPRLDPMESKTETNLDNISNPEKDNSSSSSESDNETSGELRQRTKIYQKTKGKGGYIQTMPIIRPWNFLESRQRFGQEAEESESSGNESSYYNEIVMSNFKLCGKTSDESGNTQAAGDDEVFFPRMETTYCTLNLDKNMIGDPQRHTLERANDSNKDLNETKLNESTGVQHVQRLTNNLIQDSYERNRNIHVYETLTPKSQALLVERKSMSLGKEYVYRSNDDGDTAGQVDTQCAMNGSEYTDKKPIKSALKTRSLQPGLNLSKYIESKSIKDITNESLKSSTHKAEHDHDSSYANNAFEMEYVHTNTKDKGTDGNVLKKSGENDKVDKLPITLIL